MSIESDLFAQLGILHLDHLAVTTPDLRATLADYLALPGARLLRGPAENGAQRVRYAFVTLDGATTVEILAPLEDSPIAHHLARGGGAYHLCHAVADLNHALERARALGARVLAEPTADPAFDGRRVAFLHHRAHGLLELLEAYPSDFAETPASPSTVADAPRATLSSPATDEHAERLAEILTRLFPTLGPAELESAAIDRTDGWDSASQLVLMMEIEEAFSVVVPTERIAEATDYRKLMTLIEELSR